MHSLRLAPQCFAFTSNIHGSDPESVRPVQYNKNEFNYYVVKNGYCKLHIYMRQLSLHLIKDETANQNR